MKLLQLKDTVFSRINYYNIHRIHLIGIGGIGMCGIASILAQQGYHITGSDIEQHSDTIKYLLKLGIKIFFNHCYENVLQADIIVISSAIALDNPEIQSAKQLNIPIVKRSEVLSGLMQDKYGIAVAGTHGKTTTTAILTNIFIESKLDPTFINGGIIKSEGVQARLGCSDYIITEADESDRSLLYLQPKVEIVTNIDNDHMNAYYQNFDCLKKTFIKFLHNLPNSGYAVVCIDNLIIQDILPKINRRIITYGFNKNADLCVLHYYQCMNISYFTVLIKNYKKLTITLKAVPGRHNVLNATAAIAVAIEEGVQEKSLLKAIKNFQGIERRFENLGNYVLQDIKGRNRKVILIDDYGHHPTELYATIMTIRKGWPDKRLIMVFQPHRFTRTYELFDDFIEILSRVDILLILDIYPAGEKPIVGVDSQTLCNTISQQNKNTSIFIPNSDLLLKILSYYLQDNDLILIQGAGTISSIIRSLFVHYHSLKCT